MSDLTRARQWRQRAEELRTIADGTEGKVAKEWLCEIATSLDDMADRLDQNEAKVAAIMKPSE
jgi:hypothetical protein